VLLIDVEAARLSRLNTICIVVTVVLVTCSEQLGYNLEHRRYHSIGLASCAHFPAFADGRSGAEKGGCACIGAADNRRPDPFSCSLRSVSRAFLPSVKKSLSQYLDFRDHPGQIVLKNIVNTILLLREI
jgi:hypothetical protein